MPSTLAYEPGDRVKASQNTNVRDAPAGERISTRVVDDVGTILSGPVPALLNGTIYLWWEIDWAEGVDGWCFDGGLAPLDPDQRVLVYGIDVSRHQGTISWSAVSGDGIEFAFCKGTEGGTYTDPQFVANMTNGRAAGVIMGAYHFARPENNPAETEARFFVKSLSPYLLPGNLVPVLDLESGSTLGREKLSAWTVAWCQEVERLTTLRPVIYSSRNYASNYAMPELAEWPLWIAVPGFSPGSAVAGMGPWENWTFQQYSWTGRVAGIGDGGVDVDLDTFAGTLEDLATYRIPVITHTITGSGVSSIRVEAGDRIALTCMVDSSVPRNLLLGASLFRAGGSQSGISDPTHDTLVALAEGTTAADRLFDLPSTMPHGKYDLWLALYNDFNNSGTIDSGDVLIGSIHKHAEALTVEETPPFRTWARVQGFADGEGEPSADPDGDGADNLTEYAFGTLPLSAGMVAVTGIVLVTGENQPDRVEFTFPRAANHPDLIWEVQQSTDLENWAPAGTAIGDAPFSGPGWSTSGRDPAQVTLTVQPEGNGPLFLRVKITAN